MQRPLGLLLLVLLIVSASGCAAAKKGGPYAGIDAYDAGDAARDIIDHETLRPNSPIHDRELVVAGEEKGTLPESRRPVWVVSMESFDHVKSKYCLYVWGRFTPFQGSHVTYDVDRCPGRDSV